MRCSIHIVFFYLRRYRGEVQSSARYLIIIVRKNSAHVNVVLLYSFGDFSRVQDLRAAGAQLWLNGHHCLNEAFQVLTVMFGSFIEGALTYSLI